MLEGALATHTAYLMLRGGLIGNRKTTTPPRMATALIKLPAAKIKRILPHPPKNSRVVAFGSYRTLKHPAKEFCDSPCSKRIEEREQ